MFNAFLVHSQLDHLEQHQDRIEAQTDAEAAGDPAAVVVAAFCRHETREVLAEVNWPWCKTAACAEEGELRTG